MLDYYLAMCGIREFSTTYYEFMTGVNLDLCVYLLSFDDAEPTERFDVVDDFFNIYFRDIVDFKVSKNKTLFDAILNKRKYLALETIDSIFGPIGDNILAPTAFEILLATDVINNEKHYKNFDYLDTLADFIDFSRLVLANCISDTFNHRLTSSG